MSHYSTLEGYIELLKSELDIFKQTQLFKNWLDQKQAEISHGNVDYITEGDKVRITFGDVYNRNYSSVIESDLIALCQKTTYIDIDLLIWSSDGFLTADKFYTNKLNELVLQQLRNAPMTTLYAPATNTNIAQQQS